MQSIEVNNIVEDLIISEYLGRGGFGFQHENRIVGKEDYTFVQSKGSQFYIRFLNTSSIDFITCDFVEISGRYRLVGYVENDCYVRNLDALILKVLGILKKHRAYNFSVNNDKFSIMQTEFSVIRDLNVFTLDFSLNNKTSIDCEIC